MSYERTATFHTKGRCERVSRGIWKPRRGGGGAAQIYVSAVSSYLTSALISAHLRVPQLVGNSR